MEKILYLPSPQEISNDLNQPRLDRRIFLKWLGFTGGSMILTACGAPLNSGGVNEAIPTPAEAKLQLPVISTKESADQVINADKEVFRKRPYRLNTDELHRTAQQVGLKGIDIMAHFSSCNPPTDIWILLGADDNTGKIEQMYLSVPITEKSTGWDASVSLYAGVFTWASVSNPSKKNEFDKLLSDKMNGISSNGPFSFKTETLPLKPPPTPKPNYL